MHNASLKFRVSVAPGGSGRRVLRGVTPGGGTTKASFLELNGDTVTQGWQSGGPVVGNLDLNAHSCSYDQPCPVLGVTNHLSVPYVYNWDANMEQSYKKRGTYGGLCGE